MDEGKGQETLIHCDELGKGWVYIHAEQPLSDPARFCWA